MNFVLSMCVAALANSSNSGNKASRAVSAQAIKAKKKHYTILSGLTLSSAIEAKVDKLANAFYAKASMDIVVTSGTRTAASQAAAMYRKMSKGEKLTDLYRQTTPATELQKVYDDGVKAKKTADQIRTDLEAKLKKQIAASVYISSHLKSTAVDIRSKSMTVAQRKVFKTVAQKHATKVLYEGKTDPHWHLEF